MTDEPPGTEQQWHCEAYGPEGVAEGDQVMAGLAETFTDPEQLLGGGETGTESGERGDG